MPTEVNDATIRRHLSAARVQVLDIVGTRPGVNRDELHQAWDASRPAARVRTGWTARTVDRLLWEVRNLEWVAGPDKSLALTPLGEHARELASSGS